MSKRARRRYTDKFRASAVTMLEATGYPEQKGGLQQVSNHLKVPPSTLAGWYRAEHNPPPTEVRDEKEGDLVAMLRGELEAAIKASGGARPDATWRDLMVGIGILVDKLQLLENKPTERAESTIKIVMDNDRNPDTFASPAQWAVISAPEPETLQHNGNGKALGKNGSGPEIDH